MRSIFDPRTWDKFDRILFGIIMFYFILILSGCVPAQQPVPLAVVQNQIGHTIPPETSLDITAYEICHGGIVYIGFYLRTANTATWTPKINTKEQTKYETCQ